MLPIGHPDYVYRPRSAEVRARLSAAQLARLGTPNGHARVYGIILPQKVAAIVRPMMGVISGESGRLAAEAMAANLLGKSPRSVRLMVKQFYQKRVEASKARRELRAEQTKQKRRPYTRKKREITTGRAPTPRVEISESAMDNAMLMFDEGASVDQIASALHLPRTKILARIRETKRMS